MNYSWEIPEKLTEEISPLPTLYHKGRGELIPFKIFVISSIAKLQKNYSRTHNCSLSLDGRGLGRG
jgi:hypothetical protein